MSTQKKGQGKKPADPSRFEIRSELEDGTGFKIMGSKEIFKYDQHKGWYDEYDNYYNSEGKPSQPPKEQKEEKKVEEKKEERKDAGENKPVDPSRFNDYKLLADETGFTIQGTDHVFYFDKYGGWYDEYDNYYDADGNPATDPEYSEEDDEEDEDVDVEKLAKDYADDEEEGDELEHYENLYLNTENQQIIESYKHKEIQVKAWNLPFQTTEDDFEKLLADKKIDFILFEFEYNHKDQFNGYVHLTFDKANAEKFIQLNGEKYNGRNIKIKVEKPGAADEEEDEEGHEEGHEGDEEEDHEAPETQ